MENVWCAESCIAKTDIRLLWSNMLTKERIFVLKTYYAMHLYRRVKESFHNTEFPNSVTTLSDSSILRLVRKFEEVGRVHNEPRKSRPHTVTTTEGVKEVQELAAQNPYTSTHRLAGCVKTSFCTVFRVSLARIMPHPVLQFTK